MAIVFAVLWWIFLSINPLQPRATIPDIDVQPMIDDFNTIPEELWFRNCPGIFDKYLQCDNSIKYRYIVYESNGTYVYDSKPVPKGSPESPENLTRSVEYLQGITTYVSAVVRGDLWNVVILVKKGDRYRLVHISQKRYTDLDPEY